MPRQQSKRVKEALGLGEAAASEGNERGDERGDERGLGEAAARNGLRHAISVTVSLDFEGASGMPTKDLRSLLLQNGVDIAGCLERSDLIEKLNGKSPLLAVVLASDLALLLASPL